MGKNNFYICLLVFSFNTFSANTYISPEIIADVSGDNNYIGFSYLGVHGYSNATNSSLEYLIPSSIMGNNNGLRYSSFDGDIGKITKNGSNIVGSYNNIFDYGTSVFGNSNTDVLPVDPDTFLSLIKNSDERYNLFSSIENENKSKILIGNNNIATGKNTTVIGNSSIAYGDNSTAIGNGAIATNGGVAIGNGSFSDKENTVSIGDTGRERKLTNLAAGTEDTDAVNVQQLNASSVKTLNASTDYTNVMSQKAVSISNQYTDYRYMEAVSVSNQYTDYRYTQLDNYFSQKVRSLNNRVTKVENKLNAGIAGVTAISSIPYVAENSFSYGLALGNYENANALAAGIQYKTSPNTNVRINVSWDSTRNSALGAGFSGGW